jgi:hypothetical protein
MERVKERVSEARGKKKGVAGARFAARVLWRGASHRFGSFMHKACINSATRHIRG